MSDFLSHDEKQLILYAKGHFQENNLIEDLRKITAETYWIPVESTDFGNIYGHVTRLFFKLREAKHITESMEDFMFGLFKWKREIKPEDVLEMMLSRMSTMVSIHLNIGEADEKYLPTKKAQAEKLQEVQQWKTSNLV